MEEDFRISLINFPEELEGAIAALFKNLYPNIWYDFGQDAENNRKIDYSNFEKPFRAGALVDKLVRLRQGALHKDSLEIGSYILDFISNEWCATGEKGVTLTEKEQALIVALHEAAPEGIEKNALLSAVWGYAEGLETHTLETHIYRLRQKIEADPADPKIIVTEKDGYRLGDL